MEEPIVSRTKSFAKTKVEFLENKDINQKTAEDYLDILFIK